MPSPLFRIFTALLLAAVIAPNAILFAQQPADATHFRSLFQQGQILLVRTSRETNTTSAQLLTAQQKTEFEAKRKEIEQHNQGIERQLADLRSRLSADQPIETARLLRKEFELQDEIQVIPYRFRWPAFPFASFPFARAMHF